jgi:bacillopeptidase F
VTFEGTSLTYVFTKAPNRGLAGIVIDGVPRVPVDLYSPTVQWQSRLQFTGLSLGRHTVVIRVLGQKQPASQGLFVDLDVFEVK